MWRWAAERRLIALFGHDGFVPVLGGVASGGRQAIRAGR
jgi:hypothetical protein